MHYIGEVVFCVPKQEEGDVEEELTTSWMIAEIKRRMRTHWRGDPLLYDIERVLMELKHYERLQDKREGGAPSYSEGFAPGMTPKFNLIGGVLDGCPKCGADEDVAIETTIEAEIDADDLGAMSYGLGFAISAFRAGLADGCGLDMSDDEITWLTDRYADRLFAAIFGDDE